MNGPFQNVASEEKAAPRSGSYQPHQRVPAAELLLLHSPLCSMRWARASPPTPRTSAEAVFVASGARESSLLCAASIATKYRCEVGHVAMCRARNIHVNIVKGARKALEVISDHFRTDSSDRLRKKFEKVALLAGLPFLFALSPSGASSRRAGPV